MPRNPTDQSPTPSIEDVITGFALRQHGVVTRSQLICAGVPPHVVDHRAKLGRLRRIYRGVYQVGPIAGRHAAEMAAVLAGGADVVLSHVSAAMCWQMLPPSAQDRIHVLVVAHGPQPRRGLCIHLVPSLRSEERTMHDGIPITTPARTLYDLAATADQRELERALAEALALRLTSTAEIDALLARYQRRRGARRLRNLLDGGSHAALTRSEAEERFLALIRKAQLRDPEMNVRVEGYEVDCVWRQERLVVEIDGRAFHSSDRKFESDRQRDSVLLAAGLPVMRVTWRQIVDEPEALLVRLVRALTARG